MPKYLEIRQPTISGTNADADGHQGEQAGVQNMGRKKKVVQGEAIDLDMVSTEVINSEISSHSPAAFALVLSSTHLLCAKTLLDCKPLAQTVVCAFVLYLCVPPLVAQHDTTTADMVLPLFFQRFVSVVCMILLHLLPLCKYIYI